MLENIVIFRCKKKKKELWELMDNKRKDFFFYNLDKEDTRRNKICVHLEAMRYIV